MLTGGLSYGGPCFPRDNRAFDAFADRYGINARLAKTTDEVNRFQTDHLVNLVMENISDTNAASVLGVAYKRNTPVIEESPAVKLIEELLKKNIQVMVYDPLAMDNVRAHFGDNILYASSMKNCMAHSSVCVITTPDKEFKAIDESYIVHNPTTIIDCWRILESEKSGKKVRYIALGKPKGKR